MSAIALTDLAHAARVMRSAARSHTRTWLYFIQAGEDGPIKIGLAVNPPDRLRTLQQGSPEPLCLRGVCRVYPFEEAQWHEMLAPHRILGEWFSPAPEVLEWMHAASNPLVLEEMVA